MKQRCDKKCIQNEGENTVFDTVFLRYFRFQRKIEIKRGQKKINSLDLFNLSKIC